MSKFLKNAAFTISIDFEKYWGVFPDRTIPEYIQELEGVDYAIKQLLDLFQEFEIKATWAIVGMLYYKNLQELLKDLPTDRPNYLFEKYSAYKMIENYRNTNFWEAQYFLGNDSINNIKNAKYNQEICSHTFSHFFCLEEGVAGTDFEIDLRKSIQVAESNGINTNTIIFPRNQYNLNILSICNNNGVKAFRGLANSKSTNSVPSIKVNYFYRAIRFMNYFLPLTGYNVHCKFDKIAGIWNVPESFFFNTKLANNKILRFFCLYRLKRSMKFAVKKNGLFHIWFHPHNFGKNTSIKIEMLREILVYYQHFKNNHDMKNLTMEEVISELDNLS